MQHDAAGAALDLGATLNATSARHSSRSSAAASGAADAERWAESSPNPHRGRVCTAESAPPNRSSPAGQSGQLSGRWADPSRAACARSRHRRCPPFRPTGRAARRCWRSPTLGATFPRHSLPPARALTTGASSAADADVGRFIMVIAYSRLNKDSDPRARWESLI
jgi:hypothetical protein